MDSAEQLMLLVAGLVLFAFLMGRRGTSKVKKELKVSNNAIGVLTKDLKKSKKALDRWKIPQEQLDKVTKELYQAKRSLVEVQNEEFLEIVGYLSLIHI